MLVLAALAFVVVFSVKFAARQVGAKDGTGSILFCLLAQAALSELSRRIGFGPSWLVQFVAAFAGGALVYSLLLDTTFKKGVVISLLSSAMIAIGFIVIVGLAGLKPDRPVEQASLQEMERRSLESLKRNPGYNLIANNALMGDETELRRCLSKQSAPAENFVVYMEILPDGSLGKSRAEPLTQVAECFRETAAKRRFPTPPGTYVTKNNIVFKRR